MAKDAELGGRITSRYCINCGYRTYADFKVRPAAPEQDGIAGLGATPAPNMGRPYTVQDIEQIRRGLSAGLTYKAIAERLGRPLGGCAAQIAKVKAEGRI
jgi:hypothetical protein